MRLVWKLLRRHISLLQFAGFFLANLLGTLVVLLAFQIYRDVQPILMADDGLFPPDYIILNKRISPLNTIGLAPSGTFTPREINQLRAQPFAKNVAPFTPSRYSVSCAIGENQSAPIGTEMYFESLPNTFIDVSTDSWHFRETDSIVPIILPRTYLAIYNFGYAQSRNLPKISEELVGMLQLTINMQGNGLNEYIRGRVVGFTSRLNTILVPDQFIRWSNARYAPKTADAPSRIILETRNPTDPAIAAYANQHGYELQDDKPQTRKMNLFLQLAAGLVALVGMTISLLSIIILTLSIYLLVQKNIEKMHTLLLIGYSPNRVALPYQMLVLAASAAILIIAISIILPLREFYMDSLRHIYPQAPTASLLPTIMLGIALVALVCIQGTITIRKRIQNNIE